MGLNPFDYVQHLKLPGVNTGRFYSLPQLEKEGIGNVSQLPICLRIVLESLLRNFDGDRISEKDVRALAGWEPNGERTEEIPFVVARILLQDFTGVPLLADLAAMRSAVSRFGRDVKLIEPLVPVDLIIDHSVQADYVKSNDALSFNMQMEFKRNLARYQFLKWGMQAFDNFKVIPPGIGICHQVNLEYLAKGVLERDGVYYPDSLVGADSHTTMINGLGIVGWGVGGIEAEAGMLGQPVYFLTPDVVGIHLKGSLSPGVTATDLVLSITQLLRKAKVIGKFVEYFGKGAASLSAPDRATIANMSPEYGATMGFFPVDEETCAYLSATGRTAAQVELVRRYFQVQGMFGIPDEGQCKYSSVLELNLGDIEPAVSGPKRPQDRVLLSQLKNAFHELLHKPEKENGYSKSISEIGKSYFLRRGSRETEEFKHGDVLIAAITSCTNTSNPSVMIAAGLLAKKAVEKGLGVRPTIKTSLAPGSRVVSEYLRQTGLQLYLDNLGFNVVGYGCTTCIGNSGPLDPDIEDTVQKNDLIAASVLSGNRNFEARIHQSIKANFLMSPPLVIAFALAGRIDIDLTSEPLGCDRSGKEVYLRDIWPNDKEINEHISAALAPGTYRRLYADLTEQNPIWREIQAPTGLVYEWDEESTYIQEPPFFQDFTLNAAVGSNISRARCLAIFGDSVTTDHISPAGAIKVSSPAGAYLLQRNVSELDFNTYGARRGNDKVMARGTFANVRIRNLMVPGVEGGFTLYQPDGERMSIYDASVRYQAERVPLIVMAGHEYGTGSSRDWAAKGTRLLGVRAVIAQSFERIHRSNLVGMGVLPCQFKEGTNARTLGLNGTELFDIEGIADGIRPRQALKLIIHRADGKSESIPVILRIDTSIEADYCRHGGILPYVLKQLLSGKN